jgi:hypothetical protein
VKQQFSVLPRYRAEAMGGKTWLYKTRRGADVPSAWILYEINGRRCGCAQHLLKAGRR